MRHAWALTAVLLTCGCEPSSSSGLVSLSATTLDFGQADCGAESRATRELTLANQGNVPLRWSATLDSSVYFRLDGASGGTIEPGEQTIITIATGTMPASVAAGSKQQATLRLNTNDTDQPQISIPLTAEALGATFELVLPADGDFGHAPVDVAAPDLTVTLTNTGNLPAQVSIAQPEDPQFSFSWTGGNGPVEVAPGETVPGLRAHFTPSSNAAAATAGLITVVGPVCGKSAPAIGVKGQGLAGGVGFSPAAIDLGQVGCGTTAAPRTLTIYNTGNLLYQWSATFLDGSRFTISQAAGAISAGAAQELTITPKPLEQTTNFADNAFGDTLTIQSNVAGDEIHEVPILQTAYGAVLSWTSTSPLAFAKTPLFKPSATQTLTVRNDGSGPAQVVVSGGPFAAIQSPGTIPGGGGTLGFDVYYAPDNFGPQAADITVTTETPICQALPAPVAATGEGGNAAAIAISVGGSGQPNTRGQSGQGGCAILEGSNGRIACWGTNEFGQLGTKQGTTGPFVVPGLSGVVQVSSSGSANCAVTDLGEVWCWGSNQDPNRQEINGSLGIGSIAQTEVPTKLEEITGAVQVSINRNRGCAVTDDGSVYCWGRNNLGQRNGNISYLLPHATGQTDAKAVSVTGRAVCVLRNDGTVYCWGKRCETGGEGGNGPTPGLLTPGIDDAVQIVSLGGGSGRGGAGRCVLRNDGSVNCWGRGRHGRLGNGNDTGRRGIPPVQVENVSGATAVAGGYGGGCALLADQTVQCWGRNTNGEVGNGSTSEQPSAVQVSDLDDATAIAAGGSGVCAIVTGGSIKCWGNYGVSASLTPQTLKHF